MAIKNSKFNIEEDDFFEEEVKEEPKEKFCSSCGTANNISSKFCLECGKAEFFKTRQEYEDKVNSKYCVSCKKKLNVKVKFCPQCGKNEFVKTKEELDNIYLNNKVKAWENKIKESLKELEELESNKEKAKEKTKKLNEKLKETELEYKKEIDIIKKRINSNSMNYDEKKNKLITSINEQKELKEFNELLLEETIGIEKDTIKKQEDRQKILSKSNEDLRQQIKLVEKDLKTIQDKMKIK